MKREKCYTDPEVKKAALQRIADWIDKMAPLLGPSPPAIVWYGHDRPSEVFGEMYEAYDHDDVDNVGLFPPDSCFHWADYGSYGCCSIEDHKLPNGWTLTIGYHS